MKEIIKKYSIALDILICINFFGVMAAALGAAISDGDIKLTVILGAINTVTIVLTRVTARGAKCKRS